MKFKENCIKIVTKQVWDIKYRNADSAESGPGCYKRS